MIGDRYELDELLGAGAMGNVYRGRDTKTKQQLAIKQLKPSLIRHTGAIERFTREGEALRKLNHPSIVTMIDAVEEDGSHYIVMEYVPGGDLHDTLQKNGPLSVDRALSIALDLADALTRAHRLNILHRDLKPANVLLAEDGTPRLTDFGVAHIAGENTLTADGSLVGTYAYLSPEACMGLPLDERADIWSFGVILFEILAGRRPFGGDSPAALITTILNDPLPEIRDMVPGASEDLSDLLDRMLTKNRDARIPSIRMVGAELEALIKGVEHSIVTPVGVRPSSMFGEATPTPQGVSVAHNIPAQMTPFIGREKLIQSIMEGLGINCHLATLLGPGGSGKTRLAIEIANRHVHSSALYTDGIYMVQLDHLTSPNLIATELGETLGFEFGSGDPAPQIVDYLRHKRCLLIFDNFEHVLEGAALLEDILNAAPQIHMLATSRVRLNLAAECLYEVGGLTTPTDDDAVEGFDKVEAVDMFVTYAQRAQPGYHLDEADRPHVARITRLVDGMPLGIELAASWARLLSVDEIADELADNLDFLESSARDTPQRQRSIQAVFDYSWDLLSEKEQQVFAKLAVFRGGFERKAAKTIAGASLLTLRNLVDKSLLRRSPEGRYYIHQMLRQYAERKLSDQPAAYEAVGNAHRLYYVDYVDAFRERLDGPDLELFLKAVDREYDNIIAAGQWAADHSDGIAVRRLADPLKNYYEARGRIIDAVRVFNALSEAIKGDEAHRVAYALAVIGQARFLPRLGKYEEAISLMEEAEVILREAEDYQHLGGLLTWKSYAQMFSTSIEEAEKSQLEAIDLLEDQDDRILLQTSYANYGYMLYLKGDYDTAREFMHKSEYTQEGAHNAIGAAYGFNNLGEVERVVGNYDEALRLFKRSYALFEELSNKRGMAFSSANIGEILGTQGQIDEAISMAEKALDAYREIGDRRGESETLNLLGTLHSNSLDHATQARASYTQALSLRREIGDLRGAAETMNAIGLLELDMGDYAAAENMFTRALAATETIGAPAVKTVTLNNLGLLAYARDTLDEAEDHLRQSLTLSRSTNNVQPIAFALRTLGVVELEKGNLAAARAHLNEAHAIYTEIAAINGVAFTLAWLGAAEVKAGDRAAARQRFTEGLTIVKEAQFYSAAVPLLVQIGYYYGNGGEVEEAIALLTMVLQYPLPLVGHRERTHAYLDRLREQIEMDAFISAQKKGRQQTLTDTVATLIDSLS